MKNHDDKLINSFTGKIVLDAMPQIAYVLNKEEKMVMWNKNCEKVLGYSAEELYLKDAYDFVEEHTVELNSETMKSIFSEKEEQSLEQNLITKSGKKIPIIDTANYATVNGEEYIIGMAIDVSELKETEKKLQEAIVELEKVKNELQIENVYLKELHKGSYQYENIIGESEVFLEVIDKIEKVAATETAVLLSGETGTQKERFARMIHKYSNRKEKEFLKVDCSNSSQFLREGELFGYEKGAFEGALERKIGKIELANNGTLFLYEVGDLTLDLQAKLFRVFDEGVFERAGGTSLRKVDVRIIASTKQNLEELVSKDLFRKDLFFKLTVFPIDIEALRNRVADIPLLASYYLDRYNEKLGKNIDRISKKTIAEMQNYSWPGNVRELENIIERGVIVSRGSLLIVEPLLENKSIPKNEFLPLMELEKRYITKVLERTSWRIEGNKGAAFILDMHPETLRSRMRKLEIKRP